MSTTASVKKPTDKQKKAAKLALENLGRASPLPKGEILRQAGYSAAVAETPDIVYESKGFQEVLRECGLTEDFLTTALVEDIKHKKGNRKAELELGFKVLGKLKDPGTEPLKPGTLVQHFTQINIHQPHGGPGA